MSKVFSVHPKNPQRRLLQYVVTILEQGGVIAFPTDSGYALGCLTGNKTALERICQIRLINRDHNFTLMCRDLSELSRYAFVDDTTFRLIKNNTPGSYVFILKGTKQVPKRLMNEKRKTIGLRIPNNDIDLALLDLLGQPLLTTSLILPGDELAQSNPDEIIDQIGHQLDSVVDGGHIGQKPTTVIDLTNSYPIIMRYGNGDVTPFL